ncbi:zinc ion binding [Pichia californica]|nr:zinc ion binding [[Candida] californica]
MTVSLETTDNKLTVKAITYENYSTPLKVKDIDIPVEEGTIIKPNEILVQVKATSLNPVDCILKQFSNNYFGPKDKIIGGDFSGIVVKAGDKTNFKINDKIYGDILDLKSRGSFSNFIIFDPKKVWVCEKIPIGMSFEQAASLPCVSNTAFEGIKKYNGSLNGKNVLVLGAGTSVGCFGVQFAKHYFNALNVVATCSETSTKKTLNAGADLIIDYTKGEKYKIDKLLNFVKLNGKFDLILDCVRDESVIDHFDQILNSYNENGVFAQVSGSYVLDYKNIHYYNLLPSWKSIITTLKFKLGLTKYSFIPVWTCQDDEYGTAIAKLWSEKKLNIFIDSEYDAYIDFEDAFERVASCKAHGKVVLKF